VFVINPKDLNLYYFYFRNMIVLGIESTAHTFGVAILKNKKVLSNIKDTFTTESGGLIPVKVSEHHVELCDILIKKALSDAKVGLKDIDLISYSQSPGLGHTLRIGAFVARSLSELNNIPIVGVNHCIAHLEIGKMLTNVKDPVLLYASGANTQIIAYEAGKYRVFGETLDIGVGNFLDSFARKMNLGFPGGPKIYELSLKSKKRKENNFENFIELPYVVKGMDVSFGGLLTNLDQKLKSNKFLNEDLCYSTQETVFSMLLEVTERAMAHCGKTELLLGGGVACNKRLQEMAKIMCNSRGARFYCPESQFLVDNAAMIAWLGQIEYKAGLRMELEECDIKPYLRTDEIDVFWN
jgi:N6-L-threonylcarbamoyladenine synthase